MAVGLGMKAISACNLAIITPASIVKNTIDGLFAALSENRSAVILCPSTPLCPEAFVDCKITQFSGEYVVEVEKAKSIFSEGGGTILLKINA